MVSTTAKAIVGSSQTMVVGSWRLWSNFWWWHNNVDVSDTAMLTKLVTARTMLATAEVMVKARLSTQKRDGNNNSSRQRQWWRRGQRQWRRRWQRQQRQQRQRRGWRRGWRQWQQQEARTALTTATTAATEEMSISGVLVVVSCRGQQEYLPFWHHLEPIILLWIQKN